MAKVNIAVLVSGRGSNLKALIEQEHQLNYTVHTVFADRRCPAVDLAREAGRRVVFSRFGRTHQELEALLISQLHPSIQFIVLAGYQRILSASFVGKFPRRILNIHPSLLPAFPGQGALERSFHSGSNTGVTVHFVDEDVDTGPIVAQRQVAIQPTLVEMKSAIHAAEHQLYAPTVSRVVMSG